jgi:hypothetical protein
LLWSSETGPSSWLSTNEGSLGVLGFLVNRLVYKGRWQVVIRRAPESRATSPTSGVLWRQQGLRKRDVESRMAELVTQIETGALDPETAVNPV